MTPLETSWSLGVLAWLPICGALVVALSVLAWWLLRKAAEQRGETFGWGAEAKLGAAASALVVASLLLGSAFGFYPYSVEYHQWRDTGGEVAKIDKRLISSGDGMQDKFVVRFVADGQQYGCDDTRCAGVQVGDRLTLSCKRAWQYTGTDGYDCRFVSTEPAS